MKKIFSIMIISIFVISLVGIYFSCSKKEEGESKKGEKEVPEVRSVFGPTLLYAPPLRLPQAFKVMRVVSVLPDGNLKLDGGNVIGYVGIKLPKEGTGLFKRALGLIKREVKGKEILIAYDPRIESQGKGLAYIFYDIPPALRKAGIEVKTQGKLLNTQLLAEGMARIQPKPSFERQKEFETYQAKAEIQKKGIWA